MTELVLGKSLAKRVLYESIATGKGTLFITARYGSLARGGILKHFEPAYPGSYLAGKANVWRTKNLVRPLGNGAYYDPKTGEIFALGKAAFYGEGRSVEDLTLLFDEEITVREVVEDSWRTLSQDSSTKVSLLRNLLTYNHSHRDRKDMMMSAEGVYVFLGLVLGSAFLLYMGMMALRGHFKGLYLIKGIPIAAPAGVIYTFFPGGIGALMLAIALLFPNSRIMGTIVTVGGILIMLSALLLMLWKPRWLKPWWLRWLEDNYPFLINTLLEEARQAGRPWETGIKTQENLEEWAAGVAAKYGHRVSQKP